MSRRKHRNQPRPILSILDQAHARDRETFRLFPERTQFRRKYIPGEWLDGDTTEAGPLAWVIVSSPVPGGYVWMYLPDTADDRDIAHIVTDGDTPLAHAYVVAMLKLSVAATGYGLEEVTR